MPKSPHPHRDVFFLTANLNLTSLKPFLLVLSLSAHVKSHMAPIYFHLDMMGNACEDATSCPDRMTVFRVLEEI